jgi:hypothetical protein
LRNPLPRTWLGTCRGSFNSKDFNVNSNKNGTRREAEASNVIPFRHPNGLVVKAQPEPWPGPEPKLVLDEAKLLWPPPEVHQALSAFPKRGTVTIDEFVRQERRLPYGLRITEDGTKFLVNRKRRPLFAWRVRTERPERCDPHWIDDIVWEGWFYSDDSAPVIGTSELYHALETLLDAWERGDRDAADVLGEWLRDKHLTYLELTRAYHEKLERRREVREFLEDFENMMNKPA